MTFSSFALWCRWNLFNHRAVNFRRQLGWVTQGFKQVRAHLRIASCSSGLGWETVNEQKRSILSQPEQLNIIKHQKAIWRLKKYLHAAFTYEFCRKTFFNAIHSSTGSIYTCQSHSSDLGEYDVSQKQEFLGKLWWYCVIIFCYICFCTLW